MYICRLCRVEWFLAQRSQGYMATNDPTLQHGVAPVRQLVILHPHQLRSFEAVQVLYKETTAQAEVVPICFNSLWMFVDISFNSYGYVYVCLCLYDICGWFWMFMIHILSLSNSSSPQTPGDWTPAGTTSSGFQDFCCRKGTAWLAAACMKNRLYKNKGYCKVAGFPVDQQKFPKVKTFRQQREMTTMKILRC